MSEDKRDRDRFSAIAEEMMNAPQLPKKSAQYPVVKQLTVPRIFEQVITVTDGVPSPCPRCGLQAFTARRDFEGKVQNQLWCRAVCTRDMESFAFEYALPVARGGTPIKLQNYKCGRCSRQDLVTMTLPEVNLQCWTCARITIHEPEVVTPPPLGSLYRPITYTNIYDASPYVDFGGNDVVAKAGAIPCTACSHRFDRHNGSLGCRECTCMKFVSPFDGNARARIDGNTRARAVTLNWVDPPEPVQPKKSVRDYFGEYDALVESARIKLGLVPFNEFRKVAIARNLELVRGRSEVDDRDVMRTTGRTTRGIVEAYVQATIQSAKILFVVAHDRAYEIELAKLVFDVRDKLGGVLMVSPFPINKRLEGLAGDPQLVIYVDHSYRDLGSRRYD